MVVAEKPVPEPAVVLQRFQIIRQPVVLVEALAQKVHQTGRAAVGHHVIHLPAPPVQIVFRLGIVGVVGKLIRPPADVIDPVEAMAGIQPLLLGSVVRGIRVQDAVGDVVGGGTA